MDAPQELPAHSSANPLPELDPAARLRRVERLLEQLPPILGHDLANQLVAVRGLLQVLELEEGQRLGPDGQDYVRRASAATQRAQALVSTLKEVVCLAAERPPPAEAVALADLLGEVVAEARNLSPKTAFECHLGPDAECVWAPRRLLHQALATLLRLLPTGGNGPRRIGIRSRRVPDGVELTVAEPPEADRSPRPFAPEPAGPGAPAARLDWLLVRELAAGWGGSVGAWFGTGRGGLLTLTVAAWGARSGD